MTSTTPSTTVSHAAGQLSPSSAALTVGRTLLGLAAASALLAAAGSVGVIAEAGEQTRMVETWRG